MTMIVVCIGGCLDGSRIHVHAKNPLSHLRVPTGLALPLEVYSPIEIKRLDKIEIDEYRLENLYFPKEVHKPWRIPFYIHTSLTTFEAVEKVFGRYTVED